MKKILFIIIGSITFVLGTIGIFLPFLPTAPFYIAAAFFWVNSSQRLHQFLMQNKYYQKYVQEMIVAKKMSKANQAKMLAMVFILLMIPFILVDNTPMRICLIIVFLCHLIFLPLYFKRKTSKSNENIIDKRSYLDD